MTFTNTNIGQTSPRYESSNHYVSPYEQNDNNEEIGTYFSHRFTEAQRLAKGDS